MNTYADKIADDIAAEYYGLETVPDHFRTMLADAARQGYNLGYGAAA